MAYRKPGVRVTQEFLTTAPQLATFNLPNCVIGPAYQVVSDDNLGLYSGISSDFAYASLRPGAIVDTAVLDENELADHQYPISVKLKNVKLAWIDNQTDGFVQSNLTLFKDASVSAFSTVAAGDELEVFETDIPIVGSLANGSVSNTDPDTLVGASATEYASVVEGDKVVITGGTDVTPGTYYVIAKVDDQTIQLDASFYVGAGTSADVAYSISRTTGSQNAGVYVIREVVDANTVKTQSPLKEAETLLSYRVIRKMTEATLVRDTDYTVSATGVSLVSGIMVSGKDVIEGRVYAAYRALRVDLAAATREYKEIADVQAVFGVDQIVPANPLAFGLSLSMSNTVTPVNGLALGALYATNEVLAFQAALDVIKKTELYAFAVLSQNAVVHQLFSTHVTQMSDPDRKKERVSMINKKIITIETMVDSSTTSGTRTIVNTQTAGIVTLGDNTLQSGSSLFMNVQVGDLVHIIGGTGVIAGSYVVESNDSDVQLSLGDGFIASYNGANVQYYITRADGIEANGMNLYDSNATFLADGVAAGAYLVVESGAFVGRYEIIAVTSDHAITVAQIPGIVAVEAPITYSIERDMTKTEIAEYMKGYAAAFANRRLVITFPDVVKIPQGSVVKELPGFYLGCAVAALTTGLPTQQGFTNLTVSGFLGFVHGSEYFDEDQLDIIADGGVMIFDQEVADAPLYIRHELTTDRSTIKFQEYMITKNVDFIAKFLRNNYRSMIGVYNVVDEAFDDFKTLADANLKFLKEETKQTRIGGVIRNGQLTKLAEGTNIDSIAATFRLSIPVPLNNIDITIQV